MTGNPMRPAGHGSGVRRSVALFRAFRLEQSDPAFFYGTLAQDSVEQLSAFTPLEGRVVLDVGGGPGFFREAFQSTGAHYLSLDADAGELAAFEEPASGTAIGSGLALPVRTGSVDVCYSSNVLEHVPAPWRMGGEMIRATRPGGIVFLSYTVWAGPWGGHETSPWHWLGGERAARRYSTRHGRAPKNLYGTSMFAVTAAAGLRWARAQANAELLLAAPRYAPAWARRIVDVPGLREVLTWNLLLVLRRR